MRGTGTRRSSTKDAVLAAAGQAGRVQRRLVDRRLGVELAGVDRLLDRAQVHLGIILGEDVVEAALRQPHVQRHLTAFKAVDRNARTRLLTLLAAAGGLALARTDAASDAHPALAGAIVVTKIVKLDSHCTRFRFCRALNPVFQSGSISLDGWKPG